MSDTILGLFPLGAPPWPTADPFLFCVHHDDAYPNGNDAMGPDASLDGRNIGMDFARKDGWSMYHGEAIPGFPRHPHRGFETVTVARSGFIDHSDSLGATARFGHGDVQWMTAGKGVVHSEMFPLVNQDADNPLELFQIWLNLPAKSKMCDPYFTMLWDDEIPRVETDGVKLGVIAGTLNGHQPPPPPPDSWASQPGSDVAIWTLQLEPGTEFTLPPGPADVNRTLYFFVGSSIAIDGTDVEMGYGVKVKSDEQTTIKNGDAAAEILLLQGRPIGEPVVQHGPFVMNTRDEIFQTMMDYQSTAFGGWPFDSDGPVHDRDQTRFARHADGRVEEKG